MRNPTELVDSTRYLSCQYMMGCIYMNNDGENNRDLELGTKLFPFRREYLVGDYVIQSSPTNKIGVEIYYYLVNHIAVPIGMHFVQLDKDDEDRSTTFINHKNICYLHHYEFKCPYDLESIYTYLESSIELEENDFNQKLQLTNNNLSPHLLDLDRMITLFNYLNSSGSMWEHISLFTPICQYGDMGFMNKINDSINRLFNQELNINQLHPPEFLYVDSSQYVTIHKEDQTFVNHKSLYPILDLVNKLPVSDIDFTISDDGMCVIQYMYDKYTSCITNRTVDIDKQSFHHMYMNMIPIPWKTVRLQKSSTQEVFIRVTSNTNELTYYFDLLDIMLSGVSLTISGNIDRDVNQWEL